MERESLQVVLLSCESCGSLLESESGDLVFRCANCGQGYALIEGQLKRLAVDFASPRLSEPGREIHYHPFWVLRADVNIQSRAATGGFFASFFRGRSGGEIRFYVPGFDAPLEVLRKLSMEFTKGQPSYETQTIRKSILGCLRSEEFARGFADYIFLSMEAEKPDTMRSITYSIKFLESMVLAVPFVSLNGTKKDLLMGKEVKDW